MPRSTCNARSRWTTLPTSAALRVRIALHSGTTHERDGDYFGPSVNRVARLLSTAYGGQVVVSGITAELARDRLPDGGRFKDLGMHRLRDLERAEHVFQLDFAGARSVVSAAAGR